MSDREKLLELIELGGKPEKLPLEAFPKMPSPYQGIQHPHLLVGRIEMVKTGFGMAPYLVEEGCYDAFNYFFGFGQWGTRGATATAITASIPSEGKQKEKLVKARASDDPAELLVPAVQAISTLTLYIKNPDGTENNYSAVGSNDSWDQTKGAATDAFKRAARQAGYGVSLLRLGKNAGRNESEVNKNLASLGLRISQYWLGLLGEAV